MFPMLPARRWRARPRTGLLPLATAIFVLAACSGLVEGRPSPTPLDFGGLTVALAEAGITVSGTTSGDAGCTDTNLIATAIRFDAAGLDQAAPTRLRIYIFNNQAAFDRRRADVDTCLQAWATDPATFETIDAPPYVLAGQGPWPPAFKSAMTAALRAAAGNGG